MAFPARFDLDTLDAANGFAVRGDDRFGNLGISVSIAGDVNGDGFDDVIIGAPADGEFYDSDVRGFVFGSVDKVGKSYVVFGDASGLPAEVNGDALDGSNGFVVNGIEQGDFSGRNVSGAGDVNGDGLADVIIDRRYVIFGNSSEFPPELALADLDGVNGFVLDGYVDGFDTLAVGGDLNGDGIDDLVLGDPGRYTRVPRTNERLPPETPGKTYVVFGTTDGFSPRVDVDGLNGDDGVVIAGINAADLAGSSLSAEGDVNGDGLDDLIIGAPGAGPYGETYVIFGSASGFADDLDLGDLDGSDGFVITGRIPLSVGAGIAGDFNGDGIDDVFVNNSQYPGESYIVFGRSDGFAARVDLGELSASDGVVIDKAAYDYDFRLIGAGDINGDGFDDVLATLSYFVVRAYPRFHDQYTLGNPITYVVFGRSSGENPRISLDALDGRDGFLLSPGGSVTAAGDINGDGYDDLVGAVVAEPFEESYVVFGASGGFDAEIDPRNVDGIDGFILDRWAKSTDGRGDINGDGIEDFIIGTGNYGRYSATSGGKAFVVFGNVLDSAPVIVSGDAVSVFETSFVIDILATDDADAEGAGLTYGLSGGVDAALFEIDPVSGVLSFLSTPDFDQPLDANGDNLYKVAVTVTDSVGLTGEQMIEIRVVDNRAPFITNRSSTILLDEIDSTFEFDVSAVDDADAEGAGLIYSLSGGVDRSSFEIDPGTGLVRFVDSPDFETPLDANGDNTYAVEVTVTDSAGLTGNRAFFVEILNAVEGPGLFNLRGPFFEPPILDGANGFIIDVATVPVYGAVSGAGDVNGDGLDDIIIGARQSGSPGEGIVVFGSSAGFPARLDALRLDLDEADGFSLSGLELIDQFGSSVGNAGDVNGDGLADILISAPAADPDGKQNAGEIYLLFGSTVGFSADLDLANIDPINGSTIAGLDEQDFAGFSVDGIGDINGDGLDDVVIGALRADPNGTPNAGASYVVFGSPGGFPDGIDLANLDGSNGFILNGIDQFDRSGQSVSGAGDINGDGLADLIIGAPSADPGGKSFAGESYVVFGRASDFAADFELATLDGRNGFTVRGSGEGDYSGLSVGNAGDVNGDGLDDLIIGAPGSFDGAGGAYVVFGSRNTIPASVELSSLDGSNGFALIGADVRNVDSSGQSVGGAGDINGDGYDDLIIGSAGFSALVFLVFGGPGIFPSAVDLETLDGTNGLILTGAGRVDVSLSNLQTPPNKLVGGAGDLNGDGIDDVIISNNRDVTIIFGSREFGAQVPPAGEDQVIVGTDAAEALSGGAGDDSVLGGGGGDTLDGGPGDDRLVGDGQRLEFVGASGYFDSVLGYIDPETGAATVVIENADAQAAAGFSTLLDLPGDAIWFLVPNGARLNADVAAGGGYRLAGDAEGGFFIETADGVALLGSVRAETQPVAYFSDPALNLDGKGHVRQLADGTLAWEDWINQGDRDFDDVVVKLTDTDGADVFVLGPGDGTDTIADFQLGLDRIGLKGGLAFADLAFADEAISAGGETLALLTSIDTTTLTEADFVLV